MILVWDADTSSTRKMKASALKNYIIPSSGSSEKILTFSSSGDANGIFYWLGTCETGIGWDNPYPYQIGISASSFYDNTASSADLSSVTNRADGSGFATADAAGSWLKIDLRKRSLKPSYYSLRQRSYNANLLKSWKFQGSNDNTNWTDLNTRVGQTIAVSAWVSYAITSSIFYRFFRLLQTGIESSGANFLTLGEIELYGTLRGS